MRLRALGATLLVAMGFAVLGVPNASAKEPDPVIDPNTLRSSSAVIEYLESVDAQIHWYFGAAQQAKLDAARVHTYQHASHGGGGGGSCDRPAQYGGTDALPTYISDRESHGNYGACNESSGACGKYQFLDSTWAGYGGYRSACDAPPAVQDERAAQLWNGGAGCSHWSAC